MRLKYSSCDLEHGALIHELLDKRIKITEAVRCPDCDVILLSPPDIQAALETWRRINSNPQRWATFSAAQFPSERIVKVEWGYIHTNGVKETAIQTIDFSLTKDGRVAVTRATHS